MQGDVDIEERNLVAKFDFNALCLSEVVIALYRHIAVCDGVVDEDCNPSAFVLWPVFADDWIVWDFQIAVRLKKSFLEKPYLASHFFHVQDAFFDLVP